MARVEPYAAALLSWRRKYFRELLQAADGNVRVAAQMAGLNRTQLYRSLAAYLGDEFKRMPRTVYGNAKWRGLDD